MQYEQEVSQGTHFNAHIPCSTVYFSRLVKEVNETERIQHVLHSLHHEAVLIKPTNDPY